MQEKPFSGNTGDPAAVLLRDLDELNHAVSGADLEAIQLEPGGLEARVLNIDIDELSVDRGSVNRSLRVRGGLDPERYSLGMFDGGASARLNGISVHPSTLLFCQPGLELDGHLNESYGWTSLIIPAAWIESISQAAKNPRLSGQRAGCSSVLPDPEKLHDLWAATDAIIASSFQVELSTVCEPQLSLDLRNALGVVLCEFDARTGKAESRTLSHYRTAQRAERYMRERVSEPLCIDEICIELQVSRRYLEYAFVDAFGTSPSHYFRVLRLHQVRRKLRMPDCATTVTSEALSHGFNHLGLFSTQYRALFGETPSSTLSGGAMAHRHYEFG